MVDIGEIVDHYCLNYLSIINCESEIKIISHNSCMTPPLLLVTPFICSYISPDYNVQDKCVK